MRVSRTAVLATSTAALLCAGLVAPSAYAASSGRLTGITGGTGDYGTVTVGTYVEQTFTLTSDADGTTVNGSPALGGTNADDFAVTDENCTGATLDTGASCTVTVAAAPTVNGERDAVLTISTSAGDQTQVLTVQGFVPNQGDYYAVVTSRILDTRSGLGAPKGQVHQGATLPLQVTGRGGVPAANVSAVVLNLTVTGPTAGGYVTAYPSGTTRPNVSTINFAAGWTGANAVTVPVGADGKVSLFNCCGSVSLIADVVGWYAKDAALPAAGYGRSYQTVQPQRLYDSRAAGETKLPAHSWIELDMGYGAPWDAEMSAFASTVTAVNATATGYITAYRPGTDPTKTSTLNYRPGVVTPNLAISRTAPCGEVWCGASGDPIVRYYNGGSKPVDILIDAVGFYSDPTLDFGLRYRPLTPTRIIDTRHSLGTSKLGPASTHEVTAPPSVAGDDTYALSANVTAIKASARTYLTLWPKITGFPRPTVSQLNPAAGATVAQSTMLEVGNGNIFDIYNSAGSTDLAMDVSGSFEVFPPSITTPALRAKGSAGPLTGDRHPGRTLPSLAGAPQVHHQQ